MCFPPKKTRLEEDAEKERLAEIQRKKDRKIPGIIPITDLLSGEYWKRKDAEKLRKEERRRQRLLKLEQSKVDNSQDEEM